MAYFKSVEHLNEVIGGFYHRLAEDPEIRGKLLTSKLIIKFNYEDPKTSITVDCSGAEPKVLLADDTVKAEVEMSMKADVAHQFWYGKVNLVAALTMRKIVAKGPIPKILKLLPVIKPAYVLYPVYLNEKGFSDLLL